MSPRFFMMVAATTLGLASPLFAQDSTAPATAADVQEQPVTQSLNNTVAASAETTNAVNQANQHQYDLDRAAYRAEVVARHAKVMDDAVAYDRQQAAYADAMAAWRIQTDACKRGVMKACKAPTPVPADFFR